MIERLDLDGAALHGGEVAVGEGAETAAAVLAGGAKAPAAFGNKAPALAEPALYGSAPVLRMPESGLMKIVSGLDG